MDSSSPERIENLQQYQQQQQEQALSAASEHQSRELLMQQADELLESMDPLGLAAATATPAGCSSWPAAEYQQTTAGLSGWEFPSAGLLVSGSIPDSMLLEIPTNPNASYSDIPAAHHASMPLPAGLQTAAASLHSLQDTSQSFYHQPYQPQYSTGMPPGHFMQNPALGLSAPPLQPGAQQPLLHHTHIPAQGLPSTYVNDMQLGTSSEPLQAIVQAAQRKSSEADTEAAYQFMHSVLSTGHNPVGIVHDHFPEDANDFSKAHVFFSVGEGELLLPAK